MKPENFYLGTHMLHWLHTVEFPLFVSHRRLTRNKKYFPATCDWALDSGGFSELSMYGEWRTTPKEYLEAIRRYENEIGRLRWAAPQDWMCEPHIVEKTRQSVSIHQEKTIDSFLLLSNDSNTPIIPIVQGYTMDDYLSHIDMYYKRGISLHEYQTVGIGSVCRRQGTDEVTHILSTLGKYLNIHGFGLKLQGLAKSKDSLYSADSLAWSYNARKNPPLPTCTHKSCSSCLLWATQWRNKVMSILEQD